MADNAETKYENVEMGDVADKEEINQKTEEKEKFIPEVQIEMAIPPKNETSSTASFVGLSKEELMMYADDPFWVRMRYALFIFFWVAWLAMLVAAIIIIVLAPKCPPREEQQWYDSGVMYQVQPRSFKDSDGDGMGDLNGIASKLDYLASLNVKTLWLSSIYKSEPGTTDIGYDIIDQKEVDDTLGTMGDFESLVTALHKKKEMKLVLDFVPNYTSKKHMWFMESQKGTAKYRDYYIWNAGRGTNGSQVPPSIWTNKDSKPAWTWDPTRKEYYFSMESSDRPELNLHNTDVRKELEEILGFWLSKGVDGIYVSNAGDLAELGNLLTVDIAGDKGAAYGILDDNFQGDINETKKILTNWRQIVQSNKERILITGDLSSSGNDDDFSDVANIAVNTNLFQLQSGCHGDCVYKMVNERMSTTSKLTWITGSSHVSRVASRVGHSLVDAANMLTMLLPGTAFSYYGEEIGMDNVAIPQGVNVGSLAQRAKYMTPMQWNGDNSGFSTNTSWLPSGSNINTINVKTELSVGVGMSHVEIYQALTQLRQEPSFLWGTFNYAILNKNVFSFVRISQGFDSYLVAINFGSNWSTNDYSGSAKGVVPKEGKIEFSTANVGSDFVTGAMVSLDNLTLKPGWGIVISWPNDME